MLTQASTTSLACAQSPKSLSDAQGIQNSEGVRTRRLDCTTLSEYLARYPERNMVLPSPTLRCCTPQLAQWQMILSPRVSLPQNMEEGCFFRLFIMTRKRAWTDTEKLERGKGRDGLRWRSLRDVYGNLNPVPWDLDNPASRLPQSVSSVLRRLSSCFLSFVYIDFKLPFSISRFPFSLEPQSQNHPLTLRYATWLRTPHHWFQDCPKGSQSVQWSARHT